MRKKVVESCEMCSAEVDNPVTIKVEGALLSVCQRCTSFGNIVEDPRKPQSTSVQSKSKGLSKQKRSSNFGVRTQMRSPIKQVGDQELIIEYAKTIREARAKQKLTQEQLASITGLSIPFIKSIESNKMRPTDSAVKKLERQLNIDLLITPDSEMEVLKKSDIKGTTLGDIAVIKRYDQD